MSDLEALCREVSQGRTRSLIPLLDLLEERSDWRLPRLWEHVGRLIEEQRLVNNGVTWLNPWNVFTGVFAGLFWPELHGGRIAAIKLLPEKIEERATWTAIAANALPMSEEDQAAIAQALESMKTGAALALPEGTVIHAAD